MTEVVSQARARRIAKSWGSRLPRMGTILYRGETVVDIRVGSGCQRMHRDVPKVSASA